MILERRLDVFHCKKCGITVDILGLVFIVNHDCPKSSRSSSPMNPITPKENR